MASSACVYLLWKNDKKLTKLIFLNNWHFPKKCELLKKESFNRFPKKTYFSGGGYKIEKNA